MTTGHDRPVTAADLHHVRWIAGGTGSGKTTVAQRLAELYNVLVYDGDTAERRYVAHACADQQPQFRAANLRRRYTDPARARANWDDLTPADVLPARLERDRLWDEEVRRQAHRHGLKVITTDGHQSIDQLAEQIARLFRLNPPAQHHGS